MTVELTNLVIPPPHQLTSQDKTPAVVARAIAKHNLEVEAEEGYELVQVISEERGTHTHLYTVYTRSYIHTHRPC